MPAFTVRVELNLYASADQYLRLHANMLANGFYRAVNGIDSSRNPMIVQLPPGLFYGSHDASCSIVRNIIKQVANQIDTTNSVFVAETSTWAAG